MKRKRSTRTNPFQLRQTEEADRLKESQIHVYGRSNVCCTDKRGQATPRGRSPLEIVVDASEGFIPLWTKNMMLRWRFQERSMSVFEDQEAAKTKVRELLGEALLA